MLKIGYIFISILINHADEQMMIRNTSYNIVVISFDVNNHLLTHHLFLY